MAINFRAPLITEIDKIIAIEISGFSKEEAATKEAMKERIQLISDSFIVATDKENQPIGYVVGPVIQERYLYDELFEKSTVNPETGGYQSVLSLVVLPEYRGTGVASGMLEELKRVAKNHNRSGITLTCLETLIPFYERNGYKVEGISDSQHAGETWYNMVLDL
ncbi:GNAT family N-acetyltransferase [Enterococcus sp. AZ072]|uniref:GNAT family N-acetyltransferase n=1 Tax=unclassified Enterococcus TaxID=2608891 RepID=UPI003D2CECE3